MRVQIDTAQIAQMLLTQPDLVRRQIEERLKTHLKYRGADDPAATVAEITDGWSDARYLNVYMRMIRDGEFHTHAEIAAETSQSRDQSYRHWLALYELEFEPEPGQPKRAVFDATHMQYGNDGCLFRFEDSDPFTEDNLERIISTNERRVERHYENIWTAFAELVLRQQVAASIKRKAQQAARRMKARADQLALPVLGKRNAA